MATRSLGVLTLDLIAKIGGFEQGMDRAARTADRKGREIERAMKERARAIEGAFKNIGSTIAGAFGGISLGAVIMKFTRETADASREQSQLAAVLRSTGEAAGWSQQKLNEMAAALAQSSTFSEGAINQAQTRLLSYTGVVGEQFPQAMQAAIDMAARMGMDLSQSAETIGKALDVPSKGLTALSKQGFRFTDDQKKLAERLEATGRTAEAQGIILKALESSYGGAGKAARDDFKGELEALQNTISSLLTGDSGSMEKMHESVKTLNRTLASEETRAAFQTFTGWLADVSAKAIGAAADVMAFLNSSARGRIIGDLALSEFGYQGREKGDRLAGSNIRAANRDVEFARNLLNDPSTGAAQREQAQKLMQEAMGAREYWKRMQREQALSLVDGYQDGRIAALTPRGDAKVGGNGGGGGGGAGGSPDRRRGQSDFERMLDNLQREIEKTKDLTRHEQLLADIQAGRIKGLLPGQREQLEVYAKQIDAMKLAKEAAEQESEFQKLLLDLRQQRINAGLEETDSMREQNKAMAEEVDILGLSAEARAALEKARLGSAIAIREEKINLADMLGMSEKEVDLLREQIRLLEERKLILSDKAVREAEIETQKFWDEGLKNMQQALGDGLYNIADGGFKKVGQSFLDTVRRMAANAAAAQLMKHLFGESGGGASGDSGWFGALVKAIGGSFTSTGARAHGGPAAPGGLYEVNERGTEMLRMDGRDYLMMGSQAGTVIPAVAMGFGTGGGGATKPLNVVNNTRGRVDSARYEETPQGPTLTLDEVASALDDPNSRLSKSLKRNYRMQRQ